MRPPTEGDWSLILWGACAVLLAVLIAIAMAGRHS